MVPYFVAGDSSGGVDPQVWITIVALLATVPFMALQFLPEDVRDIVVNDLRHLPLVAVLHGVVITLTLPLAAVGLFFPIDRVVWTILFSDSTTVNIYVSTLATTALYLLALFGVLTTINLLAFPQRGGILRLLAKVCCSDLERQMIPDEAILKLMERLGANCAPGIPKRQALEELNNIAMKVVWQDPYRGDRLSPIILAIETTVTAHGNPGDGDNFSETVEILNSVAKGLLQRGFARCGDMGFVLWALGCVGREGLRLHFQTHVKPALEAVRHIANTARCLRPRCAEILFELGLAALEYQAYDIATAALIHLECLVTKDSPATLQTCASYLGLLAHFWAAGSSARLRAWVSVRSSQGALPAGLCLTGSQMPHFLGTRFDTADTIGRMISDLCRRSHDLKRCGACRDAYVQNGGSSPWEPSGELAPAPRRSVVSPGTTSSPSSSASCSDCCAACRL